MPVAPAALFDSRAWCFRTKEQGFAGCEAPRRPRRRRVLPQGRGASRRRNKGLLGMRHHACRAGGDIWADGVVLPDEGIRVCGE